MGNAPQLKAKSAMWKVIVEQLANEDCVGDAWPLVCPRHPGEVVLASNIGDCQLFAPEGEQMMFCSGTGSELTCSGGCERVWWVGSLELADDSEMPLSCGHLCPSVVSVSVAFEPHAEDLVSSRRE